MKTRLIFSCISLCCCIFAYAQSPYIDRVFDYSPAPGQFTNLMPEYESGDTHESMTRKAEAAIAHNNRSMICLGGFGGSVTFGFDHDVQNVRGEYDFLISGNAVLSDNAQDGRAGGSAEPGVIYVSADENGNGLPDDKWYEIAGSEYYKPDTKHGYVITYYRTPAEHTATPSESNQALTDTSYIAWRGSDGAKGYISKNSFHRQNYYPEWISEDSVSFQGTLLAGNAQWISSSGMYMLYCYDFGYADNYPNNAEQSKIKIDWAVDENGTQVDLPSIRFVRVQTAVNQQCGWIGETSTEVLGATDLHISDAIVNIADSKVPVRIYTIQGQQLNNVSLDNLPHGVYILVYSNGEKLKLSK